MYHSLKESLESWKGESERTQQVLDALTDASLAQSIAAGHRTLGRIAWHIVTTIPEMMSYTGLKLENLLNPDKPVPAAAAEIAEAYRALSAALVDQVSGTWNDRSLDIEDDLYGQKWPRRITLMVLIQHQIHHRGQMTVLMRQAGLKVPSIYGPSLEAWQEHGMNAPEV